MNQTTNNIPKPYPVPEQRGLKPIIAKYLQESGQWDESIKVENFRHDNIVNQIIVNEDLPTEVIVSFDMLKLYLKINGIN